MTTFQIKLTILSMVSDSGYEDPMLLAKEMYDWVMEEVDILEDENKVTQLHTVQ